ncbi:MAG: hypothetical protein CVU50_07450 [Candidatus Cloacimonetes bacterium HGW-Cloacimonetes-3]|nr:MAG: hypothetical protein CVU50_07450 [Candidatus Cloacimonetes bacterium HGW-Cloacimonetes-3]
MLLLILVAAYFLLRLNKPEEKQSHIYDLDSLSIGTIEVFDQKNTLKFKKTGDVWNLTFPVAWAADTLRIQALFMNVLTAKFPKTTMGEGEEAIKNFKLQDNQALHIVVGDARGKKRIHTMFSNMGNPYDYFRYAGSDKIYQIKSKVANAFTTELSNWRSPHVVHHEEGELNSIDVTHPKGSFTLTRKKYDWFYKDAKEEFPIPTTNLGILKVVNILANLDAYVFVDGEAEDYTAKFAKPECEVTLHLTNNKTQTLDFIKNDDESYLLMVDKDSSVLFMVTFDTVFRFIRHADVFRSRAY